MSGTSRVLAILDLFTQQQPVWSIDDMIITLGYARPTAYRYIKQLIVAGLLHKTGAGKFSLGPRFIQIDYQIRQSDPVLSASIPIMAELTKTFGVSVLLSEMFGHQLINVHHAGGPEENLPFPHARGRPRPLFRGAAPKVMLAFLPRPSLVRLYEERAEAIAHNGLGDSWTDFRKYLSNIRRDKFYFSVNEVENGVAAAAVPIFDGENDVVAALSMAGPKSVVERFGIDVIKHSLSDAAERIQVELERTLSTPPCAQIE